MKILRAEYLGMCFGVRDALSLAESEATLGPATILGQLVHNEQVLTRLRSRGLQLESSLDAVKTDTVVVTAHGVSDRRMSEVRSTGKRVLDATCPLVRVAHRALADLVRRGGHPVVIGQREHVEVRGLTEDHPGCDVILTEADIEGMLPRPRFGVVSQTTQPVERVRHLVSVLQRRFPSSEVLFRDTVCQPTRQRQTAAEDLAKRCDVVVVLGGAHSNNTRELVATSARHCARVHHIQTPGDLKAEWFAPDDVVGLTAGTSTPDDLVDAVESRLESLSGAMQLPLTLGVSPVSCAPTAVPAVGVL